MSQFIIDQDTVSIKSKGLVNLFDYRVSNPFYLFAPVYYTNFYSMYLMPALALYNGTIDGVYDRTSGFNPQRLLPSVMRGLSNLLFANGIDFSCGNNASYVKIKQWAKHTKLLKTLKQGYVNCGAGGTTLFKINRNSNGELFVSQHRIDTYFVDVDSNGKISNAKIYIDMITNTVKTEDNMQQTNTHYGLVEERYFNEFGMPCVKAVVYRGSANLQTETLARPMATSNEKVDWQQLPSNVRNYIKDNYPSVIIGKEQYLPFKDYLGCMLWTFTSDIPQIPNSKFGQPIGDILQTESLQYDQLKFFERNEVDLARARALVPEDYMNPDDPDNTNTLSDRFYQKISTMNADNDKITPIQFALRSNDIRTEKENILKDIAVKLQLSASTIASFLNEGAGARTATEIISERTKTDTWVKAQISNVRDDLDEFIGYIARYYNIIDEIEIIFKCENQSPTLDNMKVNSDVYAMGFMTPELYVKSTHSDLSEAEQTKEINYLSNIKEIEIQTKIAQLQQMLGNIQTQQQTEIVETEKEYKPMANEENTSATMQVDRERIDTSENKD